MVVLTSMSDIRTKLLLGTSIGALAMIFVMAAGVDAFETKATTAIQATGINGHVTVMAVHPDGSTSYAQGDNAIVPAGRAQAAAHLFGTTAKPFNCINIGEGNIAGTPADIDVALTDTGATCGGAITNPQAAGVVDIVVPFAALTANDVAPGLTAEITEATLEDIDGIVLSHVDITTVNGVEGTLITITYTMTLT